ncbi:hypothetical protein [Nonomuraea salmonea]
MATNRQPVTRTGRYFAGTGIRPSVAVPLIVVIRHLRGNPRLQAREESDP